ncbi:N-acetylmuramoyl-L-alanine amidase [Brevibacillus reuszeri]|uniref:N-acetylmuramoyl-L-alanine amidase n=1 Tax=Brevibacillus reuszeri TaxID=54915 RepID=UPI00289B6D46|nr:N-acetylmuramoyl-L-alanine amidase [Brevibacillus reuszeri]
MNKVNGKIYLIICFCLLLTLPYSWSWPVRAAEQTSAKVLASSLNVRSEPSFEAAVVGSLSYGTMVTISKEAYGWAKISYKQTTGWVAGYYLQKSTNKETTKPSPPAPSTASSSGNKGTVTADALRMRKGPGLDQEIVQVLTLGTTLDIMGRKQDWLQVKTSTGKTGWVSATYVSEKSSSTVTPKKGKSPGLKGKVIVIDPGHGGSDVGAIGLTWKTEEKKLNQDTALKLASKLRQRGAQVILTRNSDSEKPSLAQRVAVSEAKAADAFISIHYNSSIKPNRGTLTFFYSQTKDYPLAQSIEGRLRNNLGLPSNGLSYGDYHVLRENAQPAVLVELGFLTHAKDEAIIRTASYQEKAAQAIADGLADYFAN